MLVFTQLPLRKKNKAGRSDDKGGDALSLGCGMIPVRWLHLSGRTTEDLENSLFSSTFLSLSHIKSPLLPKTAMGQLFSSSTPFTPEMAAAIKTKVDAIIGKNTLSFHAPAHLAHLLGY
jgi:hypothetical protein